MHRHRAINRINLSPNLEEAFANINIKKIKKINFKKNKIYFFLKISIFKKTTKNTAVFLKNEIF